MMSMASSGRYVNVTYADPRASQLSAMSARRPATSSIAVQFRYRNPNKTTATETMRLTGRHCAQGV